MKDNCKDFEQVLFQGKSELSAEMALHVRDCSRCSEQWRLWQEISAVAPELRKQWESPNLWPRIRQSLVAEAAHRPTSVASPFWRHWQAVAAVLVLFLLSGVAGWMMLRKAKPPLVDEERRLLTEQTLSEIERTEAAYLQSIEKLFGLAELRIEQPRTPLLASYREKLMLIDAAIHELRTTIEQNRFNAHLRRELLSIYQEKQRTLEEVIKDETHEN